MELRRAVYVYGEIGVYLGRVSGGFGVCGIPDKKWGEVGLACIVLKEGETMTEEEALKLCDDRVARFKIPRIIKFIDKLPMTAAEKIIRKKLREEYMELQKAGK